MFRYLILAIAILGLGMARPASALIIQDGTATLEQLKDFEECQEKFLNSKPCFQAIEEWVQEHPSDAFAGGKLVRRHLNAWGAIPFFARAENAPGFCRDNDVKLAVTSALCLRESEHPEIVRDTRKILFNRCFAELRETAIEALDVCANAPKNLCAGLAARKALSGTKLRQCEKR